MSKLLSPVTIQRLSSRPLPNRLVLAPMTRSRADEFGVLPPYSAEYYAQRSSAGIMITEGTQPSYGGQGYCRTPGLHTRDQVNSWKQVVSAVKQKNPSTEIFVQLMHAGRIAHKLNRVNKLAQPVAPSAVKPKGTMWTDQSKMQPFDTPVELTESGIRDIVLEFQTSAGWAREAGFYGVELHAASGYLAHQFLSSNANLRTDGYGVTAKNKCRFVTEVLEGLIKATGSPSRVGIKISPKMGFNDVLDEDDSVYIQLAKNLEDLKLGYLHIMRVPQISLLVTEVFSIFKGARIIGGGFTKEEAEATIEGGKADLVAFGSSYLANPDLDERFRQNATLNKPNPATFYTPGEKGYTDYPTLKKQ